VLRLADYARGPAFAADHRDSFDLYFFLYSHLGHTIHEIDGIEVKVAMIKETGASRAGQLRATGP
jgi:hypothetical protein